MRISSYDISSVRKPSLSWSFEFLQILFLAVLYCEIHLSELLLPQSKALLEKPRLSDAFTLRKNAKSMTLPSQQGAGNEQHHSSSLLSCRGDAAKGHCCGHCRDWGLHKDARAALAWSLRELHTILMSPHLLCSSSKWRGGSFLGCTCVWHTIHSPWSKKQLEVYRRSVTGGAWQGPEVLEQCAGVLLEEGEVEAEDNECSKCSFKIWHFLVTSIPFSGWAHSRAGPGCQASSAKGSWLEAPQGDGAVPPDVQNLILLVPIKPTKHSWENILCMAILPSCCPSSVHHLSSFSGVETLMVLWLRECKRSFFHLWGHSCLPQAMWRDKCLFQLFWIQVLQCGQSI